MTALDTAPLSVVPDIPDVTPAPTPRPSPRRLLPVALAAAVLAVVLMVVFNGPIASLWYQARQGQLAHDYSVPRSKTRAGQALADLQIPAIGLNLIVGEGDGRSQLRAGPGHRIGTPAPGQLGNSLIFGHRTGWGHPFGALGKVHAGDQVIIQDRIGHPVNLFVVTSVKVVSAHDTKLLGPSNDFRVTLISGTGGGLLSNQLLVLTAVSGTPGRLTTPPRPVDGTEPDGSLIVNGAVGWLVLLAAAGAAAGWSMRDRYRRLTVALVLAPLAMAAFVALMLELDLLLPALH
jgi:sortase A